MLGRSILCRGREPEFKVPKRGPALRPRPCSSLLRSSQSLHTPTSCQPPQVEQSYLVLFCTHASRLHDHIQSLVLTILVREPGVTQPRLLRSLSWGHVVLDMT